MGEINDELENKSIFLKNSRFQTAWKLGMFPVYDIMDINVITGITSTQNRILFVVIWKLFASIQE